MGGGGCSAITAVHDTDPKWLEPRLQLRARRVAMSVRVAGFFKVAQEIPFEF